jgi:hypothetical protein
MNKPTGECCIRRDRELLEMADKCEKEGWSLQRFIRTLAALIEQKYPGEGYEKQVPHNYQDIFGHQLDHNPAVCTASVKEPGYMHSHECSRHQLGQDKWNPKTLDEACLVEGMDDPWKPVGQEEGRNGISGLEIYQCKNKNHEQIPCKDCEKVNPTPESEPSIDADLHVEKDGKLYKWESEPTREEGWKENLYVEVMEDFLHCAEWAVKFEVRDKEKYYEELKQHYKKLENHITNLLTDRELKLLRDIEKLVVWKASLREKIEGMKWNKKNGWSQEAEKYNSALDQVLEALE